MMAEEPDSMVNCSRGSVSKFILGLGRKEVVS